MANEDCIFCKIVAGAIPSFKIFEDEYTLAFLDIHPHAKGHALVIPKEHHANLYEIPDAALCDVMKTVKRVAVAVKSAMGAAGINIAMNNDPAAGQLVFHAHFHVIPRTPGAPNRPTYAEGEAAAIAEKIRAAL